jgi:5-methyltetrahydrofolate--homocysteine methyltransferase
MFIIGERINSTRPKIQAAILSRDADSIVNEAKSQFDAGAAILDVNCAMGLDKEADDMEWVIGVIQNALPAAGICIDSPNHFAIEKALEAYKGKGEVFINSITAEPERIGRILPLAVKYKANLIALVMDSGGMPKTRWERKAIAEKILDSVRRAAFEPARLYFDPLVRPISTEPEQAKEFLAAIGLIKELGGVKTICGLSNISFGLPKRSLVNSIFLSIAMSRGLDAAILDPLDKNIASTFLTTQTILGRDEHCKNYLTAFRQGRL